MSKTIDEIVAEAGASGEAASSQQQQQSGSNEGQQNNDNAGGNQGGGEPPDSSGADALKSLLEEVGLSSVDEIKQLLASKKSEGEQQLSEEEKARLEALDKIEIDRLAVETGRMKLDDLKALESLQAKKDEDLVFEKYLNEWKDENPDVEEDEAVEQARQEFNREYRIGHENEKVRQRWADKLSKEAAEIRSPLQSTYDELKSEYVGKKELKSSFPKFTEAIDKTVSQFVPKSVDWFSMGSEEKGDAVKIDVELSEEDRKEIIDKVSEKMRTPDVYFNFFKEGKIDDIKDRVQEYAEYLVNKKVRENGNQKVAEYFLSRGIDKGAAAGATNSFAVNQAKAGATAKDERSQQEKEAEILGQYGKKGK